MLCSSHGVHGRLKPLFKTVRWKSLSCGLNCCSYKFWLDQGYDFLQQNVCVWCVCIGNFFLLNKSTICFFLCLFHFLPSTPGLCSPACTSAVLDQYETWWRRYQAYFYETSTEGLSLQCNWKQTPVALLKYMWWLQSQRISRSKGVVWVSLFSRYQQFPSLLPHHLLHRGISMYLQQAEFLILGWKWWKLHWLLVLACSPLLLSFSLLPQVMKLQAELLC